MSRSENMSHIRSKDTQIELDIRKRLWKKGIRYRINCKDIPGKPDICSKSRKIAVFLDGCFWHGCPICGNRIPKTNSDYWKKKISRNKERRDEVLKELRRLDYYVLQFWGCQIKEDPDRIVSEIYSHWIASTPIHRIKLHGI